jgi:hypothetical protein
MSDLQCPATFLFLPPHAAQAASGLAAERVAMVYDGQPAVASSAAEALAAALRVPVRPLDEPVAADAVLAQKPPAMRLLRDIADLHRGETVVVVTETGSPFRVEVDADGVRLTEPRR